VHRKGIAYIHCSPEIIGFREKTSWHAGTVLSAQSVVIRFLEEYFAGLGKSSVS